MKVRSCYATQRPELNMGQAESAVGLALTTLIAVLGLAVIGAQFYLAQVAT